MLKLFFEFKHDAIQTTRERKCGELPGIHNLNIRCEMSTIRSGAQTGPRYQEQHGSNKGAGRNAASQPESSDEIHAPAALPLAEVTVRFNPEALWTEINGTSPADTSVIS
jgi:hypothetical protein